MKPYYDKNGITIYVGDCLDVMPNLGPSFAAIIADWPYGTTAYSWDSVIPLGPLWKECKRLSNMAVLFGSQPFTTDLINSNRGWFKYEIIWDKGRGFQPQLANVRPMKAHENIIVFGKGATLYNPQKEKCKPFKSGGAGNANSKKDHGILSGSPKLPPKISTDKFPTSILSMGWEHGLHPTQKPEPLMANLIRTYTNPGDIILDNTMGSGTTLVAAQNEGRRAVGIELSEKYCKIAVERLRQPSFFSIREPENDERQTSMFDTL